MNILDTNKPRIFGPARQRLVVAHAFACNKALGSLA